MADRGHDQDHETHIEDEHSHHEINVSHSVYLTYVSLFTLLSLPTLVQFYRKRHAYFLKDRFPDLAYAQLCLCLVTWVFRDFILPFIEFDFVRCLLTSIFLRFIGGSYLFLNILRVWLLGWRIHLAKHLQVQRQQIRKFTHSSMTQINDMPLAVSWSFYLAKYAVPSLIACIFGVHSVTSVGPLFAQGCIASGAIGTHWLDRAAFANQIIATTFFCIFALFVWTVDDNFHVATEFRCYGILSLIALITQPASLAIRDEHDAIELRSHLVTVFSQVYFAVGAGIPLYHQYKLEKRVQVGNFKRLERFESVLDDQAALMTFEKFMRKEFCEEMLEFYQAVTYFKRMYQLWTPHVQRHQAKIIYASFVSEKSPSQINISATILDNIEARLYGQNSRRSTSSVVAVVEKVNALQQMAVKVKNKTKRSTNNIRNTMVQVVPYSLYDEAQQEMFKLMKEGPFARFILIQGEHGFRSSLSEEQLMDAIAS